MSRAAAVACGGGVWGLGLARWLAEAGRWSLSYRSPMVVSALAVVCAVAAIGLWRFSLKAPRLLNELPWTFFTPLVLPLPYVAGWVSRPLAGGALLVGGAGLALLLAWADRPGWALPALLGLVALGLYLGTLLPSVGEADTFEFQVVVPQLAVAHPTGYPLYVLLGKLFTLLPLRSVAWRLNLASAVLAVGAALAHYDLLRRLTGHALSSFLTALAFALSPTFWSQAVIAEVYALHNLLVAALLWLLLVPRERQDGQAGRQGRRWKLVFFVLGLSLTNHLTTVLLFPAALLAMLTHWLRHRPPWRTKDWLAAMGLFVLGLSPYLFIPIRWPALHDGAWMKLQDFLSYVTGGQFHGALRLDGWRDPTRWRIVTRLMLEPFGWIGPALAVVGMIGWAVRRRRALMVTGAAFLAFFIYGLDYYVADIAVFLIPAHLILAIWMGAGLGLLARSPFWISSRSPSMNRTIGGKAWSLALVVAFALLPLSQIWTNLPAVDRSGDRGGYAWGQYVLQQPLDEGGAVLADPKKFAPLYYLQQVEGVRPDLDIVLLGTEELYQAALRRRLGEGQTVYLARYLPNLDGFYLRSVGPLVEVGGSGLRSARAGEVEASELALARLGEGIALLDADVEEDPLGRAHYHVTLHWRAETSIGSDLVVRLRLVDADGDVPWTTDGVRPVNGLYPTNAWPPDVPISDYHGVPIEPWLAPGSYVLQVGLFPRFGGEGLRPDDGASPWLPLRTLEVELPAEPEDLGRGRLLSLGGGVWLTGADVPEEGTAGAPMTVELGWSGVAEDERVQLSWDDGGGGQAEATAAYTSSLPAGMVRSRHTIAAPREAGAYTLRVGLLGEPARCGWLAAPRSGCALADVRVLADQEGLANFGDRVLLLEAQVGRREVSPGDVMEVNLRWRGLRAMEEDYTIFVHLVGPDGRLHGQVDRWPVQGTLPTSQWRPGRGVSDPYEVRLAPDAPPGGYRVEVGLYQLETMERLRVLNAEGEPIGDSFVVGRFDVRQ